MTDLLVWFLTNTSGQYVRERLLMAKGFRYWDIQHLVQLEILGCYNGNEYRLRSFSASAGRLGKGVLPTHDLSRRKETIKAYRERYREIA